MNTLMFRQGENRFWIFTGMFSRIVLFSFCLELSFSVQLQLLALPLQRLALAFSIDFQLQLLALASAFHFSFRFQFQLQLLIFSFSLSWPQGGFQIVPEYPPWQALEQHGGRFIRHFQNNPNSRKQPCLGLPAPNPTQASQPPVTHPSPVWFPPAKNKHQTLDNPRANPGDIPSLGPWGFRECMGAPLLVCPLGLGGFQGWKLRVRHFWVSVAQIASPTKFLLKL